MGRTPPPPPAPPHPLPQNLEKRVLKWGGGVWGVRDQKLIGVCLFDKIMILQGLKSAIEPFRVGYSNRPR